MITTEDVKSFDLSSYTGSRAVVFHPDGTEEIIDTCSLLGDMAQAYKEAKRITELRILIAVPEYKQRNLAMGLYEPEEAMEYIDMLKSLRNGLKLFLERLVQCTDVHQIMILMEEYELADNTL